MDIFPSHIRSLVFLLFAFGLACVFQYIFLRRQVFSFKWVILWTFITITAFVSKNIWVLILAIAYTSFYILPKRNNERIVHYFALLPLLPTFSYAIPSLLPGINYLFLLTYPRMLILLILMPMFFKYIQRPLSKRSKLLHSGVDKLLVFYLLLLAVLAFRSTSITDSLRVVFLLIVDIALPYFVVSRYLISMKEIEQVCVAILFSAIMLAFVGFLEVKYSWGFYLQLRDLLNFLPATVAEFSEIRGGQIRIEATMGGPIPFGYFLALSMGIFLFLKDQLAISIPAIIATFSLISFALYFTGSRGGWLTAIIIVTVYQLLKIRSQRKKLGIILFGLAVLLGLTLTDNLPLYEDTTGNFEYRSQLFYNALDVIGRHPVFGTSNPNEGGALEMMRQGQGIIDIVNTYIQVALHAGIVGFVLFVSIFLVLLKQLFAKYKRSKQREKEVEYITGAILIALVAATLVLIGTVSSVSYIPTYYWSLIALGSAYVQIPPIKQADSKLGISQSVRS